MNVLKEQRREAADLIARRLLERDHMPAGDRSDVEPFAESLLTELIGYGWRPTEARPVRFPERGGNAPASPEQVRAYAEHIRAQLSKGGAA